MPQPKDWSNARIKHELDNKGYTITSLSKAFGFKHNSVSVALAKPWPKVEALVAGIIGVNPSEIWPSRYSTKTTNPCFNNKINSQKLQVKSESLTMRGISGSKKVA